MSLAARFRFDSTTKFDFECDYVHTFRLMTKNKWKKRKWVKGKVDWTTANNIFRFFFPNIRRSISHFFLLIISFLSNRHKICFITAIKCSHIWAIFHFVLWLLSLFMRISKHQKPIWKRTVFMCCIFPYAHFCFWLPLLFFHHQFQYRIQFKNGTCSRLCSVCV